MGLEMPKDDDYSEVNWSNVDYVLSDLKLSYLKREISKDGLGSELYNEMNIGV